VMFWLSHSSLGKYAPVIGEEIIGEVKNLSAGLAEKSVCPLNSTSFGGGVAEILHKRVPLMLDFGLKAEWRLIKGSDEFF
jgi:trehalose synthase